MLISGGNGLFLIGGIIICVEFVKVCVCVVVDVFRISFKMKIEKIGCVVMNDVFGV